MAITFLPHQKVAVKIITQTFLKGEKGYYLADETGMGKGITALGVADSLCRDMPERQSVLVICPSFLKPNWQSEISEKLGASNTRNYTFFIYSFNDISNLSTLRYIVKNRRYALLIVDEAHYVKDFKSIRTQVLYEEKIINRKGILVAKGVVTACDKILALSATPYANRVGEIYPFLYAIKHDLIKNKTNEDFIKLYAGKYRAMKLHRYDKKVSILSHSGVSDRITDLKHGIGKIFLRRLLKDHIDSLPPTKRFNIPIKISDKILKQEQATFKEVLRIAGHDEQSIELYFNSYSDVQDLIDHDPTFTKIVEFKKQMGLMKIPIISEYLKEIILPIKKKFILFCYYTDVAKKYQELFIKYKAKNVFLVTGKMSAQKRFDLIKIANELDECIFIATMPSVKEGLNFTGFDTSYFAEVDWAPYLHTQCEGRTARIGQKNNVFWYYFNLDRGIEKTVFKALQSKNETIEILLDTSTATNKLITKKASKTNAQRTKKLPRKSLRQLR